MTIHPSMIEKIALDAREHNAEVAADIKRSFAYVGPVTVTSREAVAGADVRNDLRLVCRMGRPYWTDEGDGAAMWEAMRTWLAGKAYKVASTMANFNTSRAQSGHQTVHYDRVELDMKPYVLGVALAQADALPAVDELAGRFRELMLAGVIPADARGAEMPSAASLARQRAEARVRAEEQAKADVPAQGEPAEPAAPDALADQAPAPLTEALAAAGVEAEAPAAPADAPAADEPSDAAAPTAPSPVEARAADRPALPHVSDGLEAVDTRVWDVLLADGSARQLDSVSGEWL